MAKVERAKCPFFTRQPALIIQINFDKLQNIREQLNKTKISAFKQAESRNCDGNIFMTVPFCLADYPRTVSIKTKQTFLPLCT